MAPKPIVYCINLSLTDHFLLLSNPHRRRKRPPPNNPPTCTGKTIPLNSILEFSIISYFKMRNVIIWHWFIKDLVGTHTTSKWCRCDVVTSHRRHYDVMCLLGILPPLPPSPPPNILNLAPPPPNILSLPTPMILTLTPKPYNLPGQTYGQTDGQNLFL